jgi:hypothetical protein
MTGIGVQKQLDGDLGEHLVENRLQLKNTAPVIRGNRVRSVGQQYQRSKVRDILEPDNWMTSLAEFRPSH